jgi:hypothetical protein
MARNLSFVPRPRRPRTTDADALQRVPATPVAAGSGALTAEPAPLAPAPDTEAEAGRVLGWLRRCTGDPALAEELTVEVFRRRAEPGPGWLDRAPDDVRLRHSVVTAVLRARGTL